MLGSQAQTPSVENPSKSSKSSLAKARYFLAWRWHFYMGLFVVPFMLMLSVTGLVMLFDDEIENARYGEILSVAPQGEPALVSTQIATVRSAYPEANVTQYVASNDPSTANRFSIRYEDGRSIFVTIDPYTAQILGEIDRSDSWYQLANNIHGTLLIGDWGDYMIEVSASLSILLLVTGIYLWLPTDNASKAGFMTIRFSSGTRVLMRDIHSNLGGALSVVLLLFLLSGLAWAGVWGAKMVQGWNTFPTYYTWGEKPQSSLTHAHLNHGSEEEMPWNLEHTELPQSHDHSQHGTSNQEASHHEVSQHEVSAVGTTTDGDGSANSSNNVRSISIDEIVTLAQQQGLTRFKIFMPKGETGVFTAAANSMAGDIIDPRQDRTLHFDQYSGKLLMDVSWDDYTMIAKLMAAGTTLHQGDASMINKLLNAFFCLSFIAIAITGALMWWIRRPKASAKLGVPARFEQEGVWRVGLVMVVAIGICFPLAGLTIVAVCFIDALIIRRSKRLQQYLA
ncbi:PepSY domain-containing protein [uncultured Vibrio sp.]|uniref:PepSY-associated TM helix domain-containing protein n=1 Tax=uncultured Vibrio sp. TaxID=114054 RepID=UPI0025FD19A8|nr:PepSY domain-containing protein [uncultured Vibrio sp.]